MITSKDLSQREDSKKQSRWWRYWGEDAFRYLSFRALDSKLQKTIHTEFRARIVATAKELKAWDILWTETGGLKKILMLGDYK